MTAALCAIVALASLVQIAHAQGPFVPTHRYSFANAAGDAPDGSVITDSVGGADGVVRGAGATFTGTRVTIPGGASATAAYIDLPNGLFSANSTNNGGSGQITLEIFTKVTGNQNWGRIFDFGSSSGAEITGPGGSGNGERYIMLSSGVGTDVNNLRFEMTGASGFPNGQNFTSDFSTTFNRDHHFVMTWDEATGVIRMYQDGVQVVQNTRTATMSDVQDVNVWLGRSNWTGDNTMQGEFDEFRIYNRVFPPEQARADFLVGPDAFPTGAVQIAIQPTNVVQDEARPVSFSTFAIGDLPITYQWYRGAASVFTPISNATNSTYSIASVTVSDSGAQFYAIASNVVSGTSYTATSQVATLTVFGDTNAPVLSRAVVNNPSLLELFFSETLRPNEATNTASYGLTGTNAPSIVSATLNSNRTRVLLQLAGPLTACESYALAISGLRDVSISANMMAPTNFTFWNFGFTGLTHRYQFNNAASTAPDGSVIVDSAGSANGLVRGAGATFTGTRVTIPGGGSGSAAYIDLPNGLFSNNSTNKGGNGQVTLEFFTRVTGARTWGRIFDFGSSSHNEITGPGGSGNGEEYIMVSSQVGDDVFNLRFEMTGADGFPGGQQFTRDFGTFFRQDIHLVLTWDEATGVIQLWQNGVQVADLSRTAAMSDIEDVNVWLGRSNWLADQNMQGEFDEFRMYNRILTSNDIAFSRVGGADNNFGALLGFNLVLRTNQLATNSVESIRALARFSNVGTQDVTFAGCVSYSSTDSNVVYISSDGTIHTGDFTTPATATVTATLGGISDSKVVTVAPDTTPPTLVSARANDSRHIEVVFSEPVDAGSSQEVGNYIVHGLNNTNEIVSVERLPDQSHVIITLSDSLATCETITVLASFVTDQSPLSNPIVEGSPINFFNYVPAGLKHRYTFNLAAGPATSGTIIPDAVGSADGTLLGGPATFTGSRVALGGGSSATAAYVDLPNGLLSVNSTNNAGSGQVTLEGFVKITGSRTWSRILDFGSSGPGPDGPGAEITGPGGTGEGIDYLFYSAQNGGDTTLRRIDTTNRKPTLDIGDGADFSVANFNQDLHFVLTWDERTGQLQAYENGAAVASFVSRSAMSDINDVNVWLGRSNWTADQNMQGEFDEFRIYDRVLSLSDITQSIALGPDFSHNTPSACGAPSSLRLAIQRTGTGTYILSFTGTPGTSYRIQRATTLPAAPNDWTTVFTQTAPAGGAVQFEDTAPPSPQAFYRVISP